MDRGMLYLSASYTDKGGANIKPLTGDAVVVLRNNKMSFNGVKTMTGFSKLNMNGMALMMIPKTPGSFTIEEIDLAGMNGITLNAAWMIPSAGGFTFEVRLDDANGKVLGTLSLPGGGAKGSESKPAGAAISGKIEPVTDGKKHKLVILSKAGDDKRTARLCCRASSSIHSFTTVVSISSDCDSGSTWKERYDNITNQLMQKLPSQREAFAF